MEQSFDSLVVMEDLTALYNAVKEMPKPESAYPSDVFTKRTFMKALERFKVSIIKFKQARSKVEFLASELVTCNAEINDTRNKETVIANALVQTNQIKVIRAHLKRERGLLTENRNALKALLDNEINKANIYKVDSEQAVQVIQQLQDPKSVDLHVKQNSESGSDVSSDASSQVSGTSTESYERNLESEAREAAGGGAPFGMLVQS